MDRYHEYHTIPEEQYNNMRWYERKGYKPLSGLNHGHYKKRETGRISDRDPGHNQTPLDKARDAYVEEYGNISDYITDGELEKYYMNKLKYGDQYREYEENMYKLLLSKGYNHSDDKDYLKIMHFVMDYDQWVEDTKNNSAYLNYVLNQINNDNFNPDNVMGYDTYQQYTVGGKRRKSRKSRKCRKSRKSRKTRRRRR